MPKKNPNDPPMPWKDLTITLIVVSCEAMTSNIITPFVTDMVTNRFGIAQNLVGVASGMLVGTFAFASFIAGFLLGHISDKYGRKWPMVLGLGTGIICTLWFAVSRSFWGAMAARFVAGATNANIGITKAVISDLTTGDNRSVAYVYQGATFAGMRAVASAVSGLLTGILIFGLTTNPYLLPCVAVAITNAFGVIVVIFLYRETRKPKPPQPSPYQPLSPTDGLINSEQFTTPRPPSKMRTFMRAVAKSTFVRGLDEARRDSLVRKVVIVLVLNSTMNGCILVALVLLFTLPIDLYGMGFSTFEMGMAYMYLGGTGFLIQIFGAKRVTRFGVIPTYMSGCFTQALGTTLIGFIPMVYVWFGYSTVTHVVTWMLVLIFMLILSYGYVSALPVLSTMLANSSNPDQQGLIQGSVQSIASLLRAFGPVASGTIFSASLLINVPMILFFGIGVCYFLCFLAVIFFFSEKDIAVCNLGKVRYEESLLETEDDVDEDGILFKHSNVDMNVEPISISSPALLSFDRTKATAGDELRIYSSSSSSSGSPSSSLVNDLDKPIEGANSSEFHALPFNTPLLLSPDLITDQHK